jgi:Fe2+ transport system protein FeoA
MKPDIALTLWNLPAGASCKIRQIKSGLPDAFNLRLADLGFQPGETVYSVITTSLGAPRLFRIDNSIYSLDDSIAMSIDITLA